MKSFTTIAAVVALASTATAHFEVTYPEMRGDSHAEGADQYIFPCANITSMSANRTAWPLTGGSIGLHLGHAWTYYAINLGLGEDVTSFNVSLTPELHNATGKGDLCTKVDIPAGLVQEGQNASIQVVTFGESGSALYNCADITFSASAPEPAADMCMNNGTSVKVISEGSTTSENAESSASSAAAAATTSATGTASGLASSMGFVGAAAVFVAALL